VAKEEIPKHVSDFIAEHIDATPQLEALLLLQSSPKSSYLAADIARELRIDPQWTEMTLARLAQAGILEAAQGGYRYAPRNPQIDQTIVDLAREYVHRRYSIISAIFSRPPESIRKFTDAFRFRKDEGT
jgi:hypothetical protein